MAANNILLKKLFASFSIFIGVGSMTIKQLNSTKVLITLKREDMRDFELSFDKISLKDEHSKKILTRLLQLACLNTGMQFNGNRFFIEALPNDMGCLLLISVVEGKKRKIYKIKKYTTHLCYRFDNATDMMNAISALYEIKGCYYSNSMYMQNDKYYLIFEYPNISNRLKILLSEYASIISADDIFISRLNEYSKLISKNNAIKELGKIFRV